MQIRLWALSAAQMSSPRCDPKQDCSCPIAPHLLAKDTPRLFIFFFISRVTAMAQLTKPLADRKWTHTDLPVAGFRSKITARSTASPSQQFRPFDWPESGQPFLTHFSPFCPSCHAHVTLLVAICHSRSPWRQGMIFHT